MAAAGLLVMGGLAVARGPGAGRHGGRYGNWSRDGLGLPVYRYTCDQTRDPHAATPASAAPGVRGSAEHTFQLGNDRIVAVASNYGRLRIRQDEGSPKFLTHGADPSAKINNVRTSTLQSVSVPSYKSTYHNSSFTPCPRSSSLHCLWVTSAH